MKNKASAFLKKVICLVSSIAKARSMDIKNKTSAAKARLIMFSIVKSKKVLVGSISDKIHGLLGHSDRQGQIVDSDDDDVDTVGDQSKAIVPYCNTVAAVVTQPRSSRCSIYTGDQSPMTEDDGDKYPDLTHSLFDEEEFELEADGGSIIDLVRNSKEEGEDFILEEEIDHVADLFIKRFHKQMRLQKLESFKRFQDMLARSV